MLSIDLSIEYQIKFLNPVDLYDVILPMFIDLRRKFKYDIVVGTCDKVRRLIVIPYKQLDKRFSEKKCTEKYLHSNFSIMYNGDKVNRKDNPEMFKYYDVKIYGDYIANNHNLHEPIDADMLNTLEKRFEYLINIFNDDDYHNKFSDEEISSFFKQRKELEEILNLQRIIVNPEYYNEIVSIYEELTTIEFTPYESDLINKILNHPKLKGQITNHGISLSQYVN